jgi:hypothetical protein
LLLGVSDSSGSTIVNRELPPATPCFMIPRPGACCRGSSSDDGGGADARLAPAPSPAQSDLIIASDSPAHAEIRSSGVIDVLCGSDEPDGLVVLSSATAFEVKNGRQTLNIKMRIYKC